MTGIQALCFDDRFSLQMEITSNDLCRVEKKKKKTKKKKNPHILQFLVEFY